MRKYIQNYIFISLGFTVITLFIIVHLLDTISILMDNHNFLVRTVNYYHNESYKEIIVLFFGGGYNSFNFLKDIIIVMIIGLIILMVFLKIYWSEKDYEKRPL